MTRGGSKRRAESAEFPSRRCLVEGESVERSTLIRFVLSPDGVVTPDILEKLGGRGVWVSAKRDALQSAIQKNAFARGFKAEAKIPADLMETLDAQLTARVISLISMARKAGEAISGAEKTAQALQNGDVRIILQANDGSEREKRNLSYRNEVDFRFECLNRSELGMAFSKENVVHAALTGDALTNRVGYEAKRLSLLRETEIFEEKKAN